MISLQTVAIGETIDNVYAYEQSSCMGSGQKFDSVKEMLNSIDRGNDWKSFRMTTHTAETNGPLTCSMTECSDLTPAKIAELKFVDDNMEVLVVTGVRLGNSSLSSFYMTEDKLGWLEGKIPLKLYNEYLEAINKAREEFEKNLKDCLLGHFPELKNENVELVLGSVGEDFNNAGYHAGTVTFDHKSTANSANIFEVDLYTFTQNVLLHEWETHRNRLHYLYWEVGATAPSGAREFDWERDTQENTYHTWIGAIGTPPPHYFVTQDNFDTTFSKLLNDYRKELGDEASGWSDDKIQAEHTKKLKEEHATDVREEGAVDLMNTPENGAYRDDEHALEPCEQLDPDD
ncbi:MAG: hypothetical protein OXH84_05345 [Gammaproteobacteria bacterium]|nr:hypothetical protein [Gammaproteobacteria bacterium]